MATAIWGVQPSEGSFVLDHVLYNNIEDYYKAKAGHNNGKTVLARGLEAKFRQNPSLKRALCLTEDTLLVSPTLSNNIPGQLIMQLRSVLQSEERQYEVAPPLLTKQYKKKMSAKFSP